MTILIQIEQVNDRVKICIDNIGSSSPEAIRQRLFDAFFTTQSIGQATALGLFISYQIVTKSTLEMLVFSKACDRDSHQARAD